MTTCAVTALAIIGTSMAAIVGFAAFVIHKAWRLSLDLAEDVRDGRADAQERRARLRKGLLGPASSFRLGRG